VLALLVATSTALVSSASASAKQFSLVIGLSSAGAGTTHGFSATITNESGGTLNSVTLAAPAGYAISSPTGGTFTGLNLAKDKSTTRPFTALVPCAAAGSSTWSATSQGYVLDAGNSSVSTTVTGNCSLKFTGQPASAQKNTTITTAPFDSSGGAVTVELDDANGASTAAADGASVVLAQSSNATALTGNSASLSSGTASFTSKDSQSSLSYTVTASVPTNSAISPSASSNVFQIWDKDIKCNANSPCNQSYQAGDLTTQPNATFPLAGGILVSYGVESSPCAADAYNHLPAVVTIDSEGHQLPSGDWVITYHVSKAFDQIQPRNGVSFYHPCLASTASFTTLDGSTSQLSSDGFYYGLMQDAPHCSAPSPCVLSKNKERSGQVVLVLQLPAGDPRTW
jgi:hypothetical protein